MEAKTQTIDLNYLQKKLNSVRKSCVTPEQKAAYKQYVQLYRNWMGRYNNEFGYRVKVDFMLMMLSGACIAILLVTIILMLIAKLS